MRGILIAALLGILSPVIAEEETLEHLTSRLKPSIVAISVEGRDGKRDGLGTGFVLSKDGLIATNYHVIGDGRKVRIEFADGKSFAVQTIHALDRKRDLAILKIDAKELEPLPIGDSTKAQDGQSVLALGNPKGLKFSVVSGILSGKREIDGQELLQLAMPIEPGNSGGPLVDRQGKVLGIINMKSLVTDNLGFAITVENLKPMLAKPNPIPMAAWLTIGQLDFTQWDIQLGGNWRQRAGRIQADGQGSGFGGRTYLVYQPLQTQLPIEATVEVKLADERGAAGLIFQHAAGVHYGFYPSGGKLRITHFQGNDVFTWKILGDFTVEGYRSNDWNSLHVQVTADHFICSVNGKEVAKISGKYAAKQQFGLAKFRDTQAEFRKFAVGNTLLPKPLDIKQWEQIGKLKTTEELSKLDNAKELLRWKANELVKEAKRLEELAAGTHQTQVIRSLVKELSRPEKEIHLVAAALHLAWLDNEELDIKHYQEEFRRLQLQLFALVDKNSTENKRFEKLRQFFFQTKGFHGARGDYYNKANSYLNEVMDDREGIPITLSVLFVELGRTLDLKMEALGLPGHLLVRFVPKEGEAITIDVFNQGEVVPAKEVIGRATSGTDSVDGDELLKGMTKRAIVQRMLRNLLNISQQEQDAENGLKYLNLVLALDENAHMDRYMRAGLFLLKGKKAEARQDVEYLLEHATEAIPMNEIRKLERLLGD